MKKLLLCLITIAFTIPAVCQVRFSNKGKYGLQDASGKVIVKAQYDFIWDFEEGYAVISKGEKHGLINSEGIETIAPEYGTLHKIKRYNLYYMSGQILNGILSKYRLYGLITPTGKVLLEPIHFNPPSFDTVFHVSEMSNNYGYGLIDTAGHVVIPVKYSEITLKGNRAVVRKNNKNGLFNLKGEMLIPMEYTQLIKFNERLWGAMIENSIEYYDNMGRKASPYLYQRGHYLQEGFGAVKRDGKYGFIDSTGKEVVACQYDTVAAFINGKSLVTLKGKQSYIDAPYVKQNTKAGQLDDFSMISMDDINAIMKNMAATSKLFNAQPLETMEDKATSASTYKEALKASQNTTEVKKVVGTSNSVKGETFEYYTNNKLVATQFFDESKKFCFYHKLYGANDVQTANRALKEANFTVETIRQNDGASTDTWKKTGYAFTIVLQYVPGNRGAGIAILSNSFLKNSKVE